MFTKLYLVAMWYGFKEKALIRTLIWKDLLQWLICFSKVFLLNQDFSTLIWMEAKNIHLISWSKYILGERVNKMKVMNWTIFHYIRRRKEAIMSVMTWCKGHLRGWSQKCSWMGLGITDYHGHEEKLITRNLWVIVNSLREQRRHWAESTM